MIHIFTQHTHNQCQSHTVHTQQHLAKLYKVIITADGNGIKVMFISTGMLSHTLLSYLLYENVRELARSLLTHTLCIIH